MSYDLAVWDGDRPSDDEAASAQFSALMDRMEAGTLGDPTPRIRAYVEALLARWPDIDEAEDSPWSTSPLIDEASGPLVYFPMVFSRRTRRRRTPPLWPATMDSSASTLSSRVCASACARPPSGCGALAARGVGFETTASTDMLAMQLPYPGAHPWRRAVFSSYALMLGIFAVVLTAVVIAALAR